MVVILGILNVTPDSFSDGERFRGPEDAIATGIQLFAAGADFVDVGGESTRPGAFPVDDELELQRVLPVVEGLAAEGVAVSVDTMKAGVAAACLEAGAVMVNDVSGGLHDPPILATVAEQHATLVLSHWRGPSRTMATRAVYDDVVAEVTAHLRGRADAARAAGVPESRLVLDPGIGFGKTSVHNWQLLANVATILDLGYPVMIGTSRKSFLGELTAQGRGAPPTERDDLTAITSALAAVSGCQYVRVHDVVATRRALAVADRWTSALGAGLGRHRKT
ncbi:MAG TPA: dihydropteroate synthase [Nocardioides sp.]|uniref:dihydropteroate synthase n=1 Tax=uncultured Nocardioides sp. TaxID=198441 RepID=UPI00261FBCFB|nr:dihydropteroate synthase [uncultured Nocardioides sp.]MDP3968942.1 dihydropteroate synthase [Nocardioides sp.]HRI93981.1 dihydropteroate synthase [Nocardioides sp.]HRK43995.1 dihydropteroate synthase [Nocardioides sp.]